MKKCQDLAKILVNEYHCEAVNKQFPKLELHINDKQGEGFRSRYAAKTLTIEAESPLALAFGINQMRIAAKAGHLAEYLGEIKPLFPLRPLWLKADIEVLISQEVSLCLPGWMTEENASALIPQLCRRLISCGFNALLLGQHTESSLKKRLNGEQVKLKELFGQFREYGIKLILKPKLTECDLHCPYNEKFCLHLHEAIDNLQKAVPSFDYLFWESHYGSAGYQDHPKAAEATEQEVTLTEIRLLEKCLRARSKLIFFLPLSQGPSGFLQARWINPLLDDMGKGTIFSFNAVSGDIFDDHAKDHPLWDLLRKSPDTSATPLLPIVNCGLIKQGEGLWPITNFDLLERFIPRCTRHRFSGIVALAPHLSQIGSLLDCNLWVAGHAQWHETSPALLAETWFKAFRPEEDCHFCLESMQRGRAIALDISYLRAKNLTEPLTGENAKTYGEAILSRMKLLNLLWHDKRAVGMQRPALKEYQALFAADLKQLLMAYLPTFSLPLAYLLEDKGPASSFWQKGLEEPLKGEKESLMEKIYSHHEF